MWTNHINHSTRVTTKHKTKIDIHYHLNIEQYYPVNRMIRIDGQQRDFITFCLLSCCCACQVNSLITWREMSSLENTAEFLSVKKSKRKNRFWVMHWLDVVRYCWMASSTGQSALFWFILTEILYSKGITCSSGHNSYILKYYII